MKNYRNTLLLLATVVLLNACSDGSVERKQVVKDIENKIGDKKHILADLQPVVERLTGSGSCSNHVKPTGIDSTDAYSTKRIGKQLEALGLITFREKLTNPQRKKKDAKYQYEMTFNAKDMQNIVSFSRMKGKCECGLLYCSREYKQNISIYIGELKNVNITGIEKVSDTVNVATFEVAAKKTNVADRLFSDFRVIEGVIEYQLWDDGWREKSFKVSNPFELSYGVMDINSSTKSDTGLAVEKLRLMHKLGKYFGSYKKLIKTILNDKDAKPWEISTAARAYCDNGNTKKAYRIFEKRILKKLEGEELANWTKTYEEFRSKCELINKSKKEVTTSHEEPLKSLSTKNNQPSEVAQEVKPKASYWFSFKQWFARKLSGDTQPSIIVDDIAALKELEVLHETNRELSALNVAEKPKQKETEMNRQQIPQIRSEPSTKKVMNSSVIPDQNVKNVNQNNTQKVANAVHESVSDPKARDVNDHHINAEKPITVVPHQQLITNAQTELKRLGLYHSGIDGVQGAGTSRAILSYQEQMGLPKTGVIDDDLLLRMRSTSPQTITPALTRKKPKPNDYFSQKQKSEKRKTIGEAIGRGIGRGIDSVFRELKRKPE